MADFTFRKLWAGFDFLEGFLRFFTTLLITRASFSSLDVKFSLGVNEATEENILELLRSRGLRMLRSEVCRSIRPRVFKLSSWDFKFSFASFSMSSYCFISLYEDSYSSYRANIWVFAFSNSGIKLSSLVL